MWAAIVVRLGCGCHTSDYGIAAECTAAEPKKNLQREIWFCSFILGDESLGIWEMDVPIAIPGGDSKRAPLRYVPVSEHCGHRVHPGRAGLKVDSAPNAVFSST